jgi:predicted MFS family arabinose efflux permease
METVASSHSIEFYSTHDGTEVVCADVLCDRDWMPRTIHRPVNPTKAFMPALSLTLLSSWGTLYYAFGVMVGSMQADLGCTPTRAMLAYSLALVVWGISAYFVGGLVSRFGGRIVMTGGSVLCGLLFLALAHVRSVEGLYAVWAGLGLGMALTLYEPAFAIVVQAFPGHYRRRIVMLTLAGGLASSVFWPLTSMLMQTVGWRGAALVYGGWHLVVCAPLHGWTLPRYQREAVQHSVKCPVEAEVERRPQAFTQPSFWLLATCFVSFSFVTSAMATHLIPLLQFRGIESVAAIGLAALIGPLQVAGRSIDLLLGSRLQPMSMGTITVVLVPLALAALFVVPMAPPLLYVFIASYGAGLGLLTIVRATTPARVFGDKAYARVSGALSSPSELARAGGPLVGTYVFAVSGGYDMVLLVLLAIASIGAIAYLRVVQCTKT